MPKKFNRLTEWNFNFDELVRQIRSKREKEGLTKRQASIGAGLNECHVFQLENKRFVPSMQVFMAVCSWLEVNPAMFFYKKKTDTHAEAK